MILAMHANWYRARLKCDNKLKQYNIDMETMVLSSDNTFTFYKYLNNKLYILNSSIPLLYTITNKDSNI